MAGPTQPAQVWAFGLPGTGSPVKSEEVRSNLDALAVLFRTNDDDFPEIKRDGMPRFNTSDPNNVKLQVWYDNDWRTLFQGIQLGIPSPTKQEREFNPAPGGSVWTITHDLGSRPLVQAYDLAGNLLELVTQNPAPRHPVSGPHLSPAVLGALGAGPTTLWTWLATFRGAVDDLIAEIREDVTGTADVTFDVTIGGTPMTGGSLNLATTPSLGARLASGAPSADNVFEVGDTVIIRSTLNSGAFTGGAIKLSLDVERRLQTGQYVVQHASQNQLVITHPVPTAGFALVVG